jgi:hypothetical protein
MKIPAFDGKEGKEEWKSLGCGLTRVERGVLVLREAREAHLQSRFERHLLAL